MIDKNINSILSKPKSNVPEPKGTPLPRSGTKKPQSSFQDHLKDQSAPKQIQLNQGLRNQPKTKDIAREVGGTDIRPTQLNTPQQELEVADPTPYALPPALSVLTGNMNNLSKEELPNLLSQNSFFQEAISGNVEEFMSAEQNVVDLGRMLELPRKIVAMIQSKLGSKQEISPSNLFKMMGIDPHKVISQIDNLKYDLQKNNLSSIMNRLESGKGSKYASPAPKARPKQQLTPEHPAEIPTEATGLAALASKVAAINGKAPTTPVTPVVPEAPITNGPAPVRTQMPTTKLGKNQFKAPQQTFAMPDQPSNMRLTELSTPDLPLGVTEIETDVKNIAPEQMPTLPFIPQAQKTESIAPVKSIIPAESVDPLESIEPVKVEPQVFKMGEKTEGPAPFDTLGSKMNQTITINSEKNPTLVAQTPQKIDVVKEMQRAVLENSEIIKPQVEDGRMPLVNPAAKLVQSETLTTNTLEPLETIEEPAVQEVVVGQDSAGDEDPNQKDEGRRETPDRSAKPAPLGSLGITSTNLESFFEETNTVETTDINTFSQRILDKAKVLAKDGGGSVLLNFDSPELGELSVALRLDGNKVGLRILSGDAGLQTTLSSELASLTEALRAQNLSLTDVEMGMNTGENLEQNPFSAFDQGREGADHQDFTDGLQGILDKVNQETGRMSDKANDLSQKVGKAAERINIVNKDQVRVQV